ncbi:MAG: hypothetical protein M1825_003022 [Sarcosagium campestre]|nr:MAG: hypothetical protein M1825_003022 [Sarcosagium campestre]
MSAEIPRNFVEKADEAALNKREEAVHVAAQWAQEKIDNFLLEIESDSKDPKLLNINYIISRRATVQVYSSKKSSLGAFVGTAIKDLVSGKIAEGLTGLLTGAIDKVLGSSSGSASTDRVYELTFDELGGLNRLDAFIFSYCFTFSGLTDFTKAVIGICIVRSAATMVDDNAFRVILTSSATVEDESRSKINEFLIKVADGQKSTLNEHGERIPVEPGVLADRARLAEVIGNGVAHSAEYLARAGKKTAGALPAPGTAKDLAAAAATPAPPAGGSAAPAPLAAPALPAAPAATASEGGPDVSKGS